LSPSLISGRGRGRIKQNYKDEILQYIKTFG
jgi:hypothetical protein